MEIILQLFTARRNARIASAVLATAIPSARLSVCPSVRLSHAGILLKRLHVARCTLHCQQNVSSFLETKKYSRGTTPSPEILAQSDLPLLIAVTFDTFYLVEPQR